MCGAIIYMLHNNVTGELKSSCDLIRKAPQQNDNRDPSHAMEENWKTFIFFRCFYLMVPWFFQQKPLTLTSAIKFIVLFLCRGRRWEWISQFLFFNDTEIPSTTNAEQQTTTGVTTAANQPTTGSVKTTAAPIVPSTVNLVQQTTSKMTVGVTTAANQPTTGSVKTTAAPSVAPMLTTLRPAAVSTPPITQSSGTRAPCNTASFNACSRFQPQLPIVSYDPVSYSNFCR